MSLNAYFDFLLNQIDQIQRMRSAIRIQSRFIVLHKTISKAEENNQLSSDEAFSLFYRLDFAKRWRLGEISSQCKGA